MEKRQTPIQKAIQFWTERFKEANEAGATTTMGAADLFRSYLEAILAEERKLLEEAWKKGGDAVEKAIYMEGPCGFDPNIYTKATNIFFNQFYK